MTSHATQPIAAGTAIAVAVRPPLNRARVEELRSIGGDELVAKIFAVYRDELAQRLPAIQAAVEADDASTVNALSHALKSVSLNVGALPIAELCAKLQKESGQGILENASATLRELALQHERLLSELEARISAK